MTIGILSFAVNLHFNTIYCGVRQCAHNMPKNAKNHAIVPLDFYSCKHIKKLFTLNKSTVGSEIKNVTVKYDAQQILIFDMMFDA